MSIPQPDYYHAFLRDAFGWGGVLTSAIGFAENCEQRGQRCVLLGVGASQPRLHEAPLRHNVTLPAPGRLWRVRQWRIAQFLREAVSKLPPPRRAFVAHSPQWALAARRAWPEVRVVYRYPCLLTHCLPFTWPTGQPASLWTRLDHLAIRRLEHRVFDSVDQILSPTAANTREIIDFHPSCASRIVEVAFGCRHLTLTRETRLARRHACEWHADTFAILAIGVCELNKGFELALRALAKLDQRFSLVILGDGPRRAELAAQVHELDLAARVRFVDPTDDLAGWFAAADCVLSTSHYDAYPNVIREAMASGRAVLVPRHDPPRVTAGVAETVTEADAGLLYDRQDLDSLVAAIRSLARDDRARQLGENGRRYAAEHFHWQRAVDILSAAHPADTRAW